MRYRAMMANIGQAGAGLVWIAFALITMGSCATYEPVSLNEVPFRDRAVTQEDNDVRVSAVVLSEDETELIFAADLYARGIQPIWLEIENNEEFTVRFLAVGLDPEYFAPLEASYISRFRWAKYANEQKDEHYLSMALGEHIQAGTTRSGFVFSHLEHGTRVFNVDIIGKEHDLRTFSFTTQVPGLETDYREIDWANLYPSDQIADEPDDLGGYSGMGSAGRSRFRSRTEVLDPRDGCRRCAELPDARRDVCAASGKMGVRPAARWRSKSGVAEFLYRRNVLC